MQILTMPNENSFTKKNPIKFQKNSINFFSEPPIYYETIIFEQKISDDFKNKPNLLENVKSNKNLHSHKETQRLKDFFYEKYLIIKKGFDKKIFFYEVLLPNLFAFCFIILLIIIQIYVNQYIFCDLDSSNILIVGYIAIRETFFTILFYILYGYYSILSILQIDNKFIFILITMISSLDLIFKMYGIDPFISYFDLFILCMSVPFLITVIYYIKHRIVFRQIIKNISLLSLILIIPLFFDHYGMKLEVFPRIKALSIEYWEHKILFQIFLYFYFVIYGKVFLTAIVNYVKFVNNDKNCEKCLIIFSKYYVIDVLSSTFPAAVLEDLNTKEAWLGIINFIFQIYILYEQNYSFFNIIKRFIWKITKKNTLIEYTPTENEIKVRKILNFVLSEMLIVFCLRSILYIWFKRVISRSDHNLHIAMTCGNFLLDDAFTIRLEFRIL